VKILLDIIKKKIVFIFFIIFFLLGLSIYNDYGIVYDEDVQRLIGMSNFDYIKNIFSENSIKSNIAFGYYGVGFELPIIFLEKFFMIEDYASIYSFRHFTIFLMSFIGSIFFYKILKKSVKSQYLPFLGILFLLASPRIFAESFYNSKDIVFMFSFMICFYYGYSFLEKPSIRNSLFFSFFCAWSINIRIAAVLIPIILIYFMTIKYLRKEYDSIFFKGLISFFVLLIFFTILFWPYMWANPIEKIVDTFFVFKNYDLDIYNFYLGEDVHAKAMHWHYIPTWLTITSPIYILIFFYLGFFRTFVRLVKRILKINEANANQDLWRGKKELFNLICFFFRFFSFATCYHF